MYAELVRKTCTKCTKTKKISEFYVCKRYADGYQSWCKSCKKQHARENPQIARNWTANNKDISNAIKQKYIKTNREKVRASKRKWSRANTKKELAKTRMYQLAKLQRTPKWLSKEEIKQIEQMYVNCPKGYEVDHIIPLRGKTISGLHVLTNLQYLEVVPNRKKSNKY